MRYDHADTYTRTSKPRALLHQLKNTIGPIVAPIESEKHPHAFIYDPEVTLPDVSAVIGQKVYARVLAVSALYLISKGKKSELTRSAGGFSTGPRTPLTANSRLKTSIQDSLTAYLNLLQGWDNKNLNELSRWKELYHLRLVGIIYRYGYTEKDLGRVQAAFASLIKTEAFSATVNSTNEASLYKENLQLFSQLTEQQIATIKQQNQTQYGQTDPVENELWKDFSFLQDEPNCLFFRQEYTYRDKIGADNGGIYKCTLPASARQPSEKKLNVLIAGNPVPPHADHKQAVSIAKLNYTQLIAAALKTRMRPDHDNIQEYRETYQRSWARETPVGEGQQEEEQGAQTEGCRPVLIDLSLLSPPPMKIPFIPVDNDDYTAELTANEAARAHNEGQTPIKVIRATVPLNVTGAICSSVKIDAVLEHFETLLNKNQRIIDDNLHPQHTRLREIKTRCDQLKQLRALGPELDHLIPTVILWLTDASGDLVHVHCKSSKDRFNSALSIFLGAHKIQHDEGDDIVAEMITQLQLSKNGQENHYCKVTDRLIKTCQIFQNRPSTLWILAYSSLGQYWPKITAYSFAPSTTLLRGFAHCLPALKQCAIIIPLTVIVAYGTVLATANKPTVTTYLPVIAMAVLASRFLYQPLTDIAGHVKKISCSNKKQPLKKHKSKKIKPTNKAAAFICVVAAAASFVLSTITPQDWFESPTIGDKEGQLLHACASVLAGVLLSYMGYKVYAKKIERDQITAAEALFSNTEYTRATMSI